MAIIAAEIIRGNGKARDFSVAALQKEWLQNGMLLENKTAEEYTPQELVNKLEEGKEEYLFNCCRKPARTVLPLLISSYRKNNSLLQAMALAWLRNKIGAARITEELKDLFHTEETVGHPKDYFEKYEQTHLYWKINQHIALLAMCKDTDCSPLINRILSQTTSGGNKVEAADLYNKNRIDLQLVPYYNRILNLCFYIERVPDTLFIKELERLAVDPAVAGQQTVDCEQTRWRLYGGLLELSIASALARCGSPKGMNILCEYLKDVHSDFRRFANRELAAVFNKDMGYDYGKWKHLIHTEISGSYKITPFSQKVADNGINDF